MLRSHKNMHVIQQDSSNSLWQVWMKNYLQTARKTPLQSAGRTGQPAVHNRIEQQDNLKKQQQRIRVHVELSCSNGEGCKREGRRGKGWTWGSGGGHRNGRGLGRWQAAEARDDGGVEQPATATEGEMRGSGASTRTRARRQRWGRWGGGGGPEIRRRLGCSDPW